jgi:hypothetical protein
MKKIDLEEIYSLVEVISNDLQQVADEVVDTKEDNGDSVCRVLADILVHLAYCTEQVGIILRA